MRTFHRALLSDRRRTQAVGEELTQANLRKREQQAKQDDESQFGPMAPRPKDDKKGQRGQKSEDEQEESLEKMLEIKFAEVRVQRGVRDLDSINPLTLKIEDIRKLPDDVAAVRQGEP